MRTHQCLALVVVGVSVFGIYYQFKHTISEDKVSVKFVEPLNITVHRNWTSYTPPTQHTLPKPSATKVAFVYLTQTPECLSSYHFSVDLLGSHQDCRCAVVVLSYRKPCTKNESFPHVWYFFKPNTTLNQGRNLLYAYSSTQLNKTGALFYIFIDEDAIITRTALDLLDPKAQITVDRKRPILRQYEDFLLRVKPAVSTTIYSTSLNRKRFKEDFFSTCCKTKNGSRIRFPEFFPMISFDLCMFATHVTAAANLFPIPLKYEKLSWWMGDIILPYRVYAKYKGQALVYSPMQILNEAHREYPKVSGSVVGYDVLMKEERALSPPLLRNNSVFNDKLFRGRRHPPYYSIVSPQFPYVPYHKNPSMMPFYGV